MDILVNGERLTLDASGALFWAAESTLVFSDLHFEKGSSYARRGVLLPPYDTRATISRMTKAIAHYRPDCVIALGDSFHDSEGAERLEETERRDLGALVRAHDWLWIEGNHDPKPPLWLGGRTASETRIRGLLFRHEPAPTAVAGEIAGHLHPCATASRLGGSVRRRCFVSDGRRMILPAFGAFTGGLDAREDAISSLFPNAFIAYVLGRTRVYAISGARGAHVLWRKNNEEIQPSSKAMTTAERP